MIRSLPRRLLIVACSLFALGPLAALVVVSSHAAAPSRNGANFLCLSVDQAHFGLCLQAPVAPS